ncbi:MAG: hypothetical protein LBF68_06120 [Christensenellaceae bacterium]|jgi:hypothetical protein|nr:hypothetical protein [Christensenellaceae bacterium]
MKYNRNQAYLYFASDVLNTNIGRKLEVINQNASPPKMAKKIDQIVFSEKDH